MSRGDLNPIPGPSSSCNSRRSNGHSQGLMNSRSTDSSSGPPSFVVASYRGLGAIPVKGQSFCACPVIVQERSRYLKCNCGEDDTDLEWIWDPVTASVASEISDDGQTVRFHVKYSCGTAAVKGSKPLSSGQYFWEIKMITPVYGTDMMVGVGTSAVELDAYKTTFCSMLGRDAEGWGLSYMGRLNHRGQLLQHGSRFGQGTILGLHLDMWHGTLTFYKNRRPMGISCGGLKGKVLYPMVCSTAAQSGMKLIKARSFQTSLQFMCCQALRRIIPRHLDVFDVVPFPPGLKEFLANNLSWLLQRTDLHMTSAAAAAPAKEEEDEKSWCDLTESEDELYKSDSSSDSVGAPTSPLLTETGEAPSWVGAFGNGQTWSSTSSSSQLAEGDGESSDSNDSSETVQASCSLEACQSCSSNEDKERPSESRIVLHPDHSSAEMCSGESASLDSSQGTPRMERHEAFESSLSEPSGSEVAETSKEQEAVSTDAVEPNHKRRKITD